MVNSLVLKGSNMQTKKPFLHTILLLAFTIPSIASAAAFGVGIEGYRETYREYVDGNERFMQQRGNMWSVDADITHRFNTHHAAKLEGRYSKGKVDYIGGVNDSKYGSVKSYDLPRKSYDIRALYEYTHPLTERLDLTVSGGLGYRVLIDQSSRKDKDDYDRKNKILYANIGTGLNLELPNDFGFQPKVSYNRMLRGRQHTYIGPSFTNKQTGGHGIEVELPLTKKFGNQSQLSFGPFYRGWKVPDSDKIEVMDDEDPSLQHIFSEPKNYTHETGFKLKYTF